MGTVQKRIELSEEVETFAPSNDDTLAPFTLAVRDVVRKLVDAHNTLEAIKAQAAEKKQWGRVGDFGHWSSQLSELLSCDHGEAGMVPYLEQMISVTRSA